MTKNKNTDHHASGEDEKEEEQLTANIERRYSQETHTAVKAFLIDRDDTRNGLSLPNVLADLILEYAYHPLLSQWEEIEIEVLYGRNRSQKMLLSYSIIPGPNASLASLSELRWWSSNVLPPRLTHASYVLPHRVDEVERQYRTKLNDSSFCLPIELKILWSIRDGLDIDEQKVLSFRLWPSISTIESILKNAPNVLQSTFVRLERTTSIGPQYYCKYDLRSGVIYAHMFTQEQSSFIARHSETNEYLIMNQTNLSHAIMFESYSHLFHCLLSRMAVVDNARNVYGLALCSSSIGHLHEVESDNAVFINLFSDDYDDNDETIAPPFNPLPPERMSHIRTSLTSVLRDSLQLRINAAEVKQQARLTVNANHIHLGYNDDVGDDNEGRASSSSPAITSSSSTSSSSSSSKRSASPSETKKLEEERSSKKQHTEATGNPNQPIEKEEDEDTIMDEEKQSNSAVASSSSSGYRDSIRSHLIHTQTMAMPNVIADLILEYSNHPLLDQWYEIESLCQQLDAKLKVGSSGPSPPLITAYLRNESAGSTSVEAVAPSRVDKLEREYRTKLDDPHFQLPQEMKLLWSIRDGLNNDQQRIVRGFNKVLLWPSISFVESLLDASTSPASSLLQSTIVELRMSQDDRLHFFDKYDFRSGVFFWHTFREESLAYSFPVEEEEEKQQFTIEIDEDGNKYVAYPPTPEPKPRNLSASTAMQGENVTPYISFESYHHLFLCIQSELKMYLTPDNLRRFRSSDFSTLRERSSLLFPILHRYPYCSGGGSGCPPSEYDENGRLMVHSDDPEYSILIKDRSGHSVSDVMIAPEQPMSSAKLAEIRSHLVEVQRDYVRIGIECYERTGSIDREDW